MGTRMGDEDVKPLEEPYERFPCNQLRRECYRRKLPVIKSGPQTNATKAGFMRLLREADAQGGGNDTQESGMPNASERSGTAAPVTAIETETLAQFRVRVPRVVSPPTSPMAFLPLPPTRPPRVQLVAAQCAKRGADERKCKKDAVRSVKKRKKTEKNQPEQPQLLSGNSFFSTQASSSAPSISEQHSVPPLEPVPIDVEPKKNIDSVEQIALARWERLHARLEVVTTKLLELRDRRDEWPPSSLGANDDSDIAFYELMRRQLQRSLLECVSHT
jgi:hypothetical protein